MIKLAKWLYNLGAKNERKRIHNELLMYIGQKPERSMNPELNFQEDENTYKGRVKTWSYAQKMIDDFFVSFSE